MGHSKRKIPIVLFSSVPIAIYRIICPYCPKHLKPPSQDSCQWMPLVRSTCQR
jgi:hypothetical protein